MRIRRVLHSVTGQAVAEGLNDCGVAVIGADPAMSVKGQPLQPFQDFVDRHALRRDTPIVRLDHGDAARRIFDPAVGVDHLEANELLRHGWIYMPSTTVAPGRITRRMVQRLAAGQLFVLIPETVATLNLDAWDLQALPLSWLDRLVIGSAVRWVLLTKRPLLIAVSPIGSREGRPPFWRLSVGWRSAGDLFVPFPRDQLVWADAS